MGVSKCDCKSMMPSTASKFRNCILLALKNEKTISPFYLFSFGNGIFWDVDHIWYISSPSFFFFHCAFLVSTFQTHLPFGWWNVLPSLNSQIIEVDIFSFPPQTKYSYAYMYIESFNLIIHWVVLASCGLFLLAYIPYIWIY